MKELSAFPKISASTAEKHKICDELGNSLSGNLDDFVSKHEKLILNYYEDVQKQAKKSLKLNEEISRAELISPVETATHLFYQTSFVTQSQNCPRSIIFI